MMAEAAIRDALAAAKQARRRGDIEEASRRCHDLLLRAGEQPGALNMLGMIALSQNRSAVAVAMFRRALAADPGSPDLHMNLATAMRAAGDDGGERAALEGALSIDQRHFRALVRLAELFERRGEEAQAADRWRGVLATAAFIDERGADMEAMLDHARSYVIRQNAAFAEALDQGLADARAEIVPSDRRRFDACINHSLGRRDIYANSCSGLHFPFLPADEFFDRRHFPWIDHLEAYTDTIRQELKVLLASDAVAFNPYVAMEPGTPENKWSPLDHKLDWSAFHLWKNGERDDAACARCPRTAAIIESLPLANLPARAPTVFFSILRARTRLPPHTGVSNVRAIVHLPLIVPDGCGFRVGGEMHSWRVGSAWVFDDTIEHEAWNHSDHDRAILIFDVWNPYINEAERRLLRAFFPLADANGYDLRARIGE